MKHRKSWDQYFLIINMILLFWVFWLFLHCIISFIYVYVIVYKVSLLLNVTQTFLRILRFFYSYQYPSTVLVVYCQCSIF